MLADKHQQQAEIMNMQTQLMNAIKDQTVSVSQSFESSKSKELQENAARQSEIAE